MKTLYSLMILALIVGICGTVYRTCDDIRKYEDNMGKTIPQAIGEQSQRIWDEMTKSKEYVEERYNKKY